jgi:hypothetical protein
MPCSCNTLECRTDVTSRGDARIARNVRLVCTVCGRVFHPQSIGAGNALLLLPKDPKPLRPVRVPKHNADAALASAEPVGTNLKKLIDSLGVEGSPGCNCESLRLEMDRLGIAGCLRERARLIAALRESAESVSWLSKLKAAGPAVWSGLVFKVNPADPIPGLFDEAVRMANDQKLTAQNRS